MDRTSLRAALSAIPARDRDGWLDRFLGIDTVPADGNDLPPGCVPYLPCPVDTVLGAVDAAAIDESDTFVDVGSGLGRAALLVHLLTGAAAVGIEVQQSLVQASRALGARMNVQDFSVIEGDASELTRLVTAGSVFFLYCPFSGARLEKLIDDLEPIARTRRIRICSVDLPLPERAWLRPTAASERPELAVYASSY